ncbi:uncharacterized protein G2W53_039384 [Senna tora]|uniref:Uncharacterized protein n=1 Tax=Senna tora TaxID=362788 RepID=A0A834SQJ7_9FABA|nr:uncharacterized protein G2W53_039384 [Senna tora]
MAAECREAAWCPHYPGSESCITISPLSLRVPYFRDRGFVGDATCRSRVGRIFCSGASFADPFQEFVAKLFERMVSRLVHLEGPRFRIKGSNVLESSEGSRITPLCRSRWILVVEDNVEELQEVMPSEGPCLPESRYEREHRAKVASRYPIDLSRVCRTSSFYVPEEEDLPARKDKKGAPLPICWVPIGSLSYGYGNIKVYESKLDGVVKLRQFWERVLASHPRSSSYGIVGGDKGSLRIMSTDGVGFVMYTYAMERLGVKSPLTSFGMVVLSHLNLYPTQLTSIIEQMSKHLEDVKDLNFRPLYFSIANWVPEVVEAHTFAILQPMVDPLADEGDFIIPFTSLCWPGDGDTDLPPCISSPTPQGTGASSLKVFPLTINESLEKAVTPLTRASSMRKEKRKEKEEKKKSGKKKKRKTRKDYGPSSLGVGGKDGGLVLYKDGVSVQSELACTQLLQIIAAHYEVFALVSYLQDSQKDRISQLEAMVGQIQVDHKRYILTNSALTMAEFSFCNVIRQLKLKNPSLQLGRADYEKEVFDNEIRAQILADEQLVVHHGLVNPLRDMGDDANKENVREEGVVTVEPGSVPTPPAS